MQSQNVGDVQAQAEQRAMKEEQEQRQRDMKNDILSKILDQGARARLNTIAITKPEKAQAIENMLINMARSGNMARKVDESELKGMLARIASSSSKGAQVKFDRRRAAIDSDDDDF